VWRVFGWLINVFVFDIILQIPGGRINICGGYTTGIMPWGSSRLRSIFM
jgi:hypothetical protein